MNPTTLNRTIAWPLRTGAAAVLGLGLQLTAQAACMGMELQAHRGAPGHPENSRSSVLAAMKGAWEGAEIDIQSLSDDVLVLHHDLLTTRTTSLQRRAVRQLDSSTWAEVRMRYQGKVTNERAAFLHEILPAVEASGKVLNVEIKQEFRNCEVAENATRMLLAGLPSGRWGISATDFAHLRCVRKLDAHAYLGAISTDDVSIALSDKRSASRAHYLKSPDIHPQILLKLKRDVPPPMGLHLDVFSLRANPNLLADALQFKIPVFTYSMRGDDFHTSELKQHLQRTNMLPSGAIIDGTPQDFCRKMAS